jgi:hypothetical protein
MYMWYLLFVWMEYKKQIKKVYTGHFAECDTRQRGALPSVRVITLGKEPRPGHRYRFFAECNVYGTQQRSKLCECHTKHSAKYLKLGPPLADSLPSAARPTLGKGNFFAECHLGHSAKMPSPSTRRHNGCFSLPSAPLALGKPLCRVPKKKYSTKKALPMHCVPSPLCRVFLRLCRVLQALGKAGDSGSDYKC